MIAAFLLLAQDVPPASAPAEEQYEEIVVQASLGRTTMLFDKGADGKLRNCRIMVSSGSQAHDVAACKETPVCYAGTADEVTDCRALTVIEQAAVLGASPAEAPGRTVDTFTMPKLVTPVALAPAGQFGPITAAADSAEADRQSVKLPPLPKAPGDGPAVKITLGTPDDGKEERR